MLYSSSLRRTATVVWQRRNVDDLSYLNAGTMASTDSGFTTVTWTFDISLHFAETQIVSYLCAILSCHLSSVGIVLLRTAETHLSGRRPRDDLTFTVSQRYDDVVE